MTVEKQLQNYILSKYRSIREFTQVIDMPYSTFATILNRGVDNSSVTNIIKICKGLGISADDLANGDITPISSSAGPSLEEETADLLISFTEFEKNIRRQKKIVARDHALTSEELKEILDILEIGLEIGIRRIEEKRKSANKNHNRNE